MSEIEKYYNGEIHVDFEDEYEKMSEYELRLILRSADELIKNDSKEIRVLRDENDRLKSIIKEVREYIKYNMEKYIDYQLTIDPEEILYLLDKENK